MCGLISALNLGKNKEIVNEYIRMQLEDQKDRGMRGFGAIFINPDRTFFIKRATEPASIHVDLALNPSRMIILHHRWPTATDNLIWQTHPIIVSNGSLEYDYLLIHNGIISNDDKIKHTHQNELGFNYTTEYCDGKFNDSEALAIEVARYIEKQITQLDIEGSYAFITIQVNKKTNKVDNLFFGRNSSPLNMAMSWATLKLASEGTGDEIQADTLYRIPLLNINRKNFTKFEVFKSPLVQKPQPAITHPLYPQLPKTTGVSRLHYGNLIENKKEMDPTEEFKETLYDAACEIIDDWLLDIEYGTTETHFEHVKNFKELLKANKEEAKQVLVTQAILGTKIKDPYQTLP